MPRSDWTDEQIHWGARYQLMVDKYPKRASPTSFADLREKWLAFLEQLEETESADEISQQIAEMKQSLKKYDRSRKGGDRRGKRIKKDLLFLFSHYIPTGTVRGSKW